MDIPDVDIKAELAAAEPEAETKEAVAEVKTEDVSRETKPVITEVEKKMVPLEALHEARIQNKELKEMTRQLNERLSKGEERFQKFLEAATQKDQPQPPAFEQDPLAHLKYENDTLRKQLGEVNGKVSKFDESIQQNAQLNETVRRVQAAGSEFIKSTPDYAQAYDYIRNIRAQDLADLGTPPEQIPVILEQEELGLAISAVNGGKSPTEALYNISKRYGYKPVAKQEIKSDTKLENIQKGQEAAKTQDGGRPNAPLTLSALAEMSEDEIDALVKDPKLWKKAIGAA